MHNTIMSKYPNYKNTCSINNLSDGCITFIRSKKYLNLADHKDVIVLVPKELEDLPDGWNYEFVDHVDYVFTMLHNTLYKDTVPERNIIGKNCSIHPTAVLDVEGMHVTKAPDGRRIQLKQMGNVSLGDDVMVLALATLQRAVFGSTIIECGVKIDSHVNIGHNSVVGQNSVIALGAILGGSVTLGKNCMVGLGAVIRNTSGSGRSSRDTTGIWCIGVYLPCLAGESSTKYSSSLVIPASARIEKPLAAAPYPATTLPSLCSFFTVSPSSLALFFTLVENATATFCELRPSRASTRSNSFASGVT